MVDHQTQVDPKFQTAFLFTRVTGQRVRDALREDQRLSESQIPSPRTIRRILNRSGFRLRRVQKTKPLKKIPETLGDVGTERHSGSGFRTALLQLWHESRNE